MKFKNMFIFSTLVTLASVSQATQYIQTTVEGRLVQALVDQGTRSERQVLAVKNTYKFITLRVKGQNPFQIDEELSRYVGHSVSCSGLLSNKTLFDAVCEILD